MAKSLAAKRRAFYDRHTRLGGEIESLRLFDFVINRRLPLAFLYLFAVTHLSFFALNFAMRWQWVPLSSQWYSALIGDALLDALCVVCIAVLNAHAVVQPVFRRRAAHYAILTAWLLFGLSFLPREHLNIGDWSRQLGPTPLYHSLVVCPTLGYLVTVLVIAVFKRAYVAPSRIIVGLALAVCVGGWILAALYDGAHQFAPGGTPKFAYSAPEDGWRNLRLLVYGVWRLLE